MAYIGNTLGTIYTQSNRLHYLSDTDKLSGLLDSFDLGGGESAPSSSPTDTFGNVLSIDTFDNNNLGHILTMDLGSL